MKSSLFRLKIIQAEMYDLGNIDNISHYILYDSGSKIGVEITAEINQAPLLSKVSPYEVIRDTSVIEGLMNGTIKPAKNIREKRVFPHITGFEKKELTNKDYTKLRESMILLRDSQRTLEEEKLNMRKYCLEAKLIHKSKE